MASNTVLPWAVTRRSYHPTAGGCNCLAITVDKQMALLPQERSWKIDTIIKSGVLNLNQNLGLVSTTTRHELAVKSPDLGVVNHKP